MNSTRLLLAAASLALFAGCGQMAFSPSALGDPARVLSGEVDIPDVSVLPPDASVTVRIVDMSVMPSAVLGAQTITSPGTAPVAFRVEYRAEDELLIRGLNIEVRVSYGGKVQYYNRNRYAVSLGNATDSHRITVERSGS